MSRLQWLLRQRVLLVAVKAALASGLAFHLGSLMPPPVDEYKYYAALGAFTVVGLVLVDSVKESLQVFGAVALGVSVALVVQYLTWTNSVTVAITMAVGVVLGSTRIFGVQRTWAPLAALFVLATGGADPEPMALGYLVQVPLGALVGIVVNTAVLAPLGDDDLEPASRAVLRTMSVEMDSYADLLEQQNESGDDPDAAAHRADAVHDNVVQLERVQARLRGAIVEARRAMRGNPRARLRADQHLEELERAEAISRCAATLLAVGVVLNQSSPAQDEDGVTLRHRSAEALRCAARVFADPEQAREQTGTIAESTALVDRMLRLARSSDSRDGLDSVLFGALALAIGDCLATFARRVVRMELPDPDGPA